jgi:hypothetical protein
VELRSNVRLAENLLDGVCFESRRSRLEEGLVGAELTSRGKGRFWGLDCIADGLGDGRDHLGVEHKGGLAVLEGFHGESDILGRYGGELINLMIVSLRLGLYDTDSTYTRLDQETLETSNTSLDERKQLIGIARDDTTVETNIDPALSLTGAKLLLEAMEGSGRRNGVKRHVNDGGNTTTGSSTGTSPEALPLGSTRLVQVNMSIDETGHENLGAMIDIVCTGRKTGWGKDFGDDWDNLSSDGANNNWSGSDNKRLIRKSDNDSGWHKDRERTLGVLLSAGRSHDGW